MGRLCPAADNRPLSAGEWTQELRGDTRHYPVQAGSRAWNEGNPKVREDFRIMEKAPTRAGRVGQHNAL